MNHTDIQIRITHTGYHTAPFPPKKTFSLQAIMGSRPVLLK